LENQEAPVFFPEGWKVNVRAVRSYSEATAGANRSLPLRPGYPLKMSIASKEARETHYWLRIINESKIVIPDGNFQYYLDEVTQIVNILTKIIKTSRGNK